MKRVSHFESTAHCAAGTEDQQVVLVFQGGGALGAYQAGVYEALHEAGIEPDWIIGTSIGAINAALVAGNQRHRRLAALEAFWQRMMQREAWPAWAPWSLAPSIAYWRTLASGIGGFFEPHLPAFWGAHTPLGADSAGYYSTHPLRRTLEDLIDFSLVNGNAPRLMVGAAHVRSSRMHYFDTREIQLDVRHVMASGALPPAFPAVRIDGELYWDGGILSNTPTEAIFDDPHRRSSLIFAVHLWNPVGREPSTIWEVMHRQKDIQYSSRVASHVARQQEAHRLRHVIEELAGHIPEAVRASEPVRSLLDFGCPTRMHVVRLLAPSLVNEDHTKDVDFSRDGIASRWRAGYEDTRNAIAQAPWRQDCDPLEGVILHEADGQGRYRTDAAAAPIEADEACPIRAMEPAA